MRVFVPYQEVGNLAFSTSERFLATTETPLPEGLCGGPAIDRNGKVCGVIEGIVPKGHKDERIAGAASFLPSLLVTEFLGYAERLMLKEIFPEELFDKVVDIKTGKPLDVGSKEIQLPNRDGRNEKSFLQETYRNMVEYLKKAHSVEEVNAVLNTVEREREEVLEILNREGGDVDEIIARVRQRTRQVQQEILDKMQSGEMQEVRFKEEETKST
mmetsp:Transcript_16676/g.38323  ORF Transcript_16676/g.38323 Transcript_16676/m.38323 type:complete len:214 (+) Transcript_16676:250-891(+)